MYRFMKNMDFQLWKMVRQFRSVIHTANLDAETENAVLSALKRVAKDRTVISISHRTSAEFGKSIVVPSKYPCYNINVNIF